MTCLYKNFRLQANVTNPNEATNTGQQKNAVKTAGKILLLKRMLPVHSQMIKVC